MDPAQGNSGSAKIVYHVSTDENMRALRTPRLRRAGWSGQNIPIPNLRYNFPAGPPTLRMGQLKTTQEPPRFSHGAISISLQEGGGGGRSAGVLHGQIYDSGICTW